MEVIKVAIADDHKIFRKGVILSLRTFTKKLKTEKICLTD